MKLTELIQFEKKVIGLFDDHTKKHKMKPMTRICIRYFPTEFEISGTNIKSSFSSEIVSRPDWGMKVHDFMEKEIKQLPEFSELVQSIAKKYKQNILTIVQNGNEVSQSTFWLGVFTQRLIYERLEGSLTDDLLIERASLFKSELELALTEHTYIHYLDGLFLGMERLVINDNVLFRKVQKEDLEYERDILFDSPSPQYMDMGLPSSIMEVNISAKDERDCYNYINRIFNSLRLYKLGSIYSKETTSTRKTAIWSSGVSRSWGIRRYSPLNKYTLENSEADVFVSFVNKIEQKLAHIVEKERRVLDITINRYNSALLDPVDSDIRLMTAVMGLESLLTLEKDRGENAYKLGVRVAKLLSHFHFNVEEVRKITEEAYEFRNKVVHGSFITQTQKVKINEILHHVLNCCQSAKWDTF